jgi:hypothetical protein
MLVAVVVEVLVAGVVEVVIAGYFGWRSEAFLGFFSVCGGNLEGLFNLKCRSTISSI